MIEPDQVGRDARRGDWQTRPMPGARAILAIDTAFTSAEMERVRRGVIPQEMEDKWFIFMEGDTVFFHRSWTGVCVYRVKLRHDDPIWRIVEAQVNRDPDQYSETDPAYDSQLLRYLFDALLIGRPARFPARPGSPDVVQQWASVGRAMLGQGPGQSTP